MDFWLPIAVLIILVLGVLILFDLRSADGDDDDSEEGGEDDDSGLESSWDAYFRKHDERRRKH
jgi:hypothetical protein